MKPVRVLVTGAGSGVGQGIIKSLRICNYPVTIISADISPFNSALYRADEALIIPKVEDLNALTSIIKIINANNINVVMVGSEFDLMFFSKNKEHIYSKTGAITIVSPSETVAIADDKWLTAKFLQDNCLPHAESFISDTLDEVIDKAVAWGFPIIVKARNGTSSRNVFIVENIDELVKIWPNTPCPILQKLIDIPSTELNNEYTCSIFKTLEGTILGPFHARRTLRGGTSWHIEVDLFPEIGSLLTDIGKVLEFQGSLNVQLMVSESGPIPFEINARFSGTTAVRSHFGFNEPALALQSYYYKEEPKQPIIGKGVAFRYHEEVFIDDENVSGLVPNITKGIVREWF
jgi:carbamoyl-phosphate synthase large subunit